MERGREQGRLARTASRCTSFCRTKLDAPGAASLNMALYRYLRRRHHISNNNHRIPALLYHGGRGRSSSTVPTHLSTLALGLGGGRCQPSKPRTVPRHTSLQCFPSQVPWLAWLRKHRPLIAVAERVSISQKDKRLPQRMPCKPFASLSRRASVFTTQPEPF